MEDTVFTFETVDDIDEYFSETGNNDVKYPFALGNENIYYMAHQKIITVEEFKTSKMFDEYQYLYKKGTELKGCEDDSMVEYGNEFLNCQIIESSTFSL